MQFDNEIQSLLCEFLKTMALYINVTNQRLPTVFLNTQHWQIRPPQAPKKDTRSPNFPCALRILQYEIFIKRLTLIGVSRRCPWASNMGQIVLRKPSMRAHLSFRGLRCRARWPDWGRMPLIYTYVCTTTCISDVTYMHMHAAEFIVFTL